MHCMHLLCIIISIYRKIMKIAYEVDQRNGNLMEKDVVKKAYFIEIK